MRLGLCCDPTEGPAALARGYDYVEYPAAATEPSETTYLFFPPGLRLYDDLFRTSQEALTIALERIVAASSRGVQIMALGSGNQRRADLNVMPESSDAFLIERFGRTFYDLAAALDRHAQTLGLRVAPESLGPEETNVGTSLPDLARALAERGVGYTADSYHALRERNVREADLDFWRAQIPFAPSHVHFGAYERDVPAPDDPSMRAFFARLRELGFDGRASLECKRDGIPDPAPLRRLFRASQ